MDIDNVSKTPEAAKVRLKQLLTDGQITRQQYDKAAKNA